MCRRIQGRVELLMKQKERKSKWRGLNREKEVAGVQREVEGV